MEPPNWFRLANHLDYRLIFLCFEELHQDTQEGQVSPLRAHAGRIFVQRQIFLLVPCCYVLLCWSQSTEERRQAKSNSHTGPVQRNKAPHVEDSSLQLGQPCLKEFYLQRPNQGKSKMIRARFSKPKLLSSSDFFTLLGCLHPAMLSVQIQQHLTQLHALKHYYKLVLLHYRNGWKASNLNHKLSPRPANPGLAVRQALGSIASRILRLWLRHATRTRSATCLAKRSPSVSFKAKVSTAATKTPVFGENGGRIHADFGRSSRLPEQNHDPCRPSIRQDRSCCRASHGERHGQLWQAPLPSLRQKDSQNIFSVCCHISMRAQLL